MISRSRDRFHGSYCAQTCKSVAPLSALTCLRELRYDHRVDRLVATPVDELASLRNGTLYHAEEQRVDEQVRARA